MGAAPSGRPGCPEFAGSTASIASARSALMQSWSTDCWLMTMDGFLWKALARVAPGRVALVNAQQDSRTNRLAVEHAVSGQVRLLYVSPERFASPGFLERIRHAALGLFVVRRWRF